MKNNQTFFGKRRFFSGLALFAFSASTVLLVTDPYVMLDIAFIILSVWLMISGLMTRNEEFD